MVSDKWFIRKRHEMEMRLCQNWGWLKIVKICTYVGLLYTKRQWANHRLHCHFIFGKKDIKSTMMQTFTRHCNEFSCCHPRIRAWKDSKEWMVEMFDYFGNEIDFYSEKWLSYELEKRCQTKERFLTSKFRLFATETVLMQSEVSSVLTFQTLIGN